MTASNRENDEALIGAFLRGDPNAIRTLSEWVARIVRLRAWRLRRDEDLSQDILVELLASFEAGRFEGRSSLRLYAERVAKYRCIDAVRRERHRRHLSLEESGEPEPAGSDRPDRKLDGREELRLCHAVLCRLPESCRELLRRVLAEEVGYEFLAKEEGVAVGTIKSRVARCRKHANDLRRRLTADPARPGRRGSR